MEKSFIKVYPLYRTTFNCKECGMPIPYGLARYYDYKKIDQPVKRVPCVVRYRSKFEKIPNRLLHNMAYR